MNNQLAAQVFALKDLNIIYSSLLFVLLLNSCQTKPCSFNRNCKDVTPPDLKDTVVIVEGGNQSFEFNANFEIGLKNFLKGKERKLNVGGGFRDTSFSKVREVIIPKYSPSYKKKYNDLKATFDPGFLEICKNKCLADSTYFSEKRKLTEDFRKRLLDAELILSEKKTEKKILFGRVLIKNREKAVGAKVAILDYVGLSDITDENGYFTFEVSDSGIKHLDFEISLGKCGSTFKKRVVFDSEDIEVNLEEFNLNCKDCFNCPPPVSNELIGQLLDDSGQGIKGKKIYSQEGKNTMTNEAGFFKMKVKQKGGMIKLTYPLKNGGTKSENVGVNQKNIVLYYD